MVHRQKARELSYFWRRIVFVEALSSRIYIRKYS